MFLFKAYSSRRDTNSFSFRCEKLNATREKECPDFPLKGGQALGIPATVTEAKVGRGRGSLAGSMETGDAGGLAPGPDGRQRPRARRRGAPGHRARQGRPRCGAPATPTSPRRNQGCGKRERQAPRRPSEDGGTVQARPGDAVNGVFRAEALYLPGRPEFWAVFFGRQWRWRRGWRWQREW